LGYRGLVIGERKNREQSGVGLRLPPQSKKVRQEDVLKGFVRSSF